MYYTDFEKKEIFEDRQAAIISSREKAKKAFVNSIATVTISHHENGDEFYYNTCDLKYDEIANNFKLYQELRETVYEVCLKELYPKLPS